MDLQTTVTLLATLAAFALVLLFPSKASAHCDTEDGPAVRDGRTALRTGSIAYALKWIDADGEDEVRAAFGAAQAARESGDDTAAVDRAFVETLIRVHRAGEGEPFEGIKPAGTPIDPVVAAADDSLVTGDIGGLRGLVARERLPELERRFQTALARKDFDVNDVQAGRQYVAAYVSYVKFAEGEEHGDDHHHRHEHDHRRFE